MAIPERERTWRDTVFNLSLASGALVALWLFSAAMVWGIKSEDLSHVLDSTRFVQMPASEYAERQWGVSDDVLPLKPEISTTPIDRTPYAQLGGAFIDDAGQLRVRLIVVTGDVTHDLHLMPSQVVWDVRGSGEQPTATLGITNTRIKVALQGKGSSFLRFLCYRGAARYELNDAYLGADGRVSNPWLKELTGYMPHVHVTIPDTPEWRKLMVVG